MWVENFKIFDFTNRGPCLNIVSDIFIVSLYDGFFPYLCAWPLYFDGSWGTPEPVFAFSILWQAGFPLHTSAAVWFKLSW
jgi:hypothetical protein